MSDPLKRRLMVVAAGVLALIVAMVAISAGAEWVAFIVVPLMLVTILFAESFSIWAALSLIGVIVALR